MDEGIIRQGDEQCQKLCGPLGQLACALLKIASGQDAYGGSAFPGGQKQLNGIIRKYVALAIKPNTCRDPNAATEIEALTKPE